MDVMDMTTQLRMDSREYEQMFAGCAFISPDAVREQAGWLSPSRIGDDAIRKYWEMILAHKDPVESAFEAGIYLDLIGWSADAASVLHAGAYAREIDRLSILRQGSVGLSKLMTSLQNKDYDGYRAVVDSLYQQMPAVDDSLPHSANLHLDFLESLDSDSVGLKTFIEPLDNCLGGLDRQTMTILAARPSLGKTTFAWQISRQLAQSGRKVVYFSLEMSKLALWRKAACGTCGLDWRDVKNHRISEAQHRMLIDTSVGLVEKYGDRLMVDDRTTHTTQDIAHMVVKNKPDLFVVDVLGRLKNKGEREVTRLGDIGYSLREIAKECNCHCLAVHHVNRDVSKREGHRPTMADLRESGELEQAADYILLMDSDSYYEEAPQPRKINGREYFPVKVIVAKNREGARQQDVELAFDVAGQWFEKGGILHPDLVADHARMFPNAKVYPDD